MKPPFSPAATPRPASGSGLEVMGKPEDVSSINAACAIKVISNLVGMANLAVLAEGMRLG